MRKKTIFALSAIVAILVLMNLFAINSLALDSKTYSNAIYTQKVQEDFLKYISFDYSNVNVDDFGKTKIFMKNELKKNELKKNDENEKLDKSEIIITKPEMPMNLVMIDSDGQFSVRGFFKGEKAEKIICKIFNYDASGRPLGENPEISAVLSKPNDVNVLNETRWFVPQIKFASDAARIVIGVVGESGNVYSTAFVAVRNEQVRKSLRLARLSYYGINENMIRSYEALYSDKDVLKKVYEKLKKFNMDYPEIAKLMTIGKSVQGRELSVIKIGTGAKKIFINATHHPREYIGTILVMNQIEEILKMYAGKKSLDQIDVRELLQNVTYYFMPVVNPDGLQMCITSEPGRYYNANGINLNENYDKSFKKTKNGKPTKVVTKAFSEPETNAIREFCLKENFDLSIAYHSAGEIIYWYFGQVGDQKTRDYGYAQTLKDLTGYNLVDPLTVKLDDGKGFKDWVITTFKKPAFTIEVGKGAVIKPVPVGEYRSILLKNFKIPVTLGKIISDNS